MSDTILAVTGLRKAFPIGRTLGSRMRPGEIDRVLAVDGVSFDLRHGETLGIVGESGSGKSTLARCVIQLYVPDEGRIVFDGEDVSRPGKRDLRQLRRRVQMIFQDPYGSLNPRLSIESALVEAGRVHHQVPVGGETRFVSQLLDTVGLGTSVARARPRQLSGGQRQRVAIARALAVGPDVLIADEAVSALDVSVQAQILNLLGDLKRRLNLSMIFISHQLSVVAYVADRVAVMYLGSIVECGSVQDVFGAPQHPYTKALLDADPVPDPTQKHRAAAALGEIPSSLAMPSGCRFKSRCPYAQSICEQLEPRLEEVADDHYAACHVRPFA